MAGVEVPEGLSVAGAALWRGVSSNRDLDAASRVLLLNACRSADLLDLIDGELEGAPLTVTIFGKNGEPVNEVAQPLLGEHRQQFATLSMILARLGVGALPKVRSAGRSSREKLADKRAERVQAEVAS